MLAFCEAAGLLEGNSCLDRSFRRGGAFASNVLFARPNMTSAAVDCQRCAEASWVRGRLWQSVRRTSEERRRMPGLPADINRGRRPAVVVT